MRRRGRRRTTGTKQQVGLLTDDEARRVAECAAQLHANAVLLIYREPKQPVRFYERISGGILALLRTLFRGTR